MEVKTEASNLLKDNYVYASVPFEFSPTVGLLAVGGVFGLNYLRKKTAVSKIES